MQDNDSRHDYFADAVALVRAGQLASETDRMIRRANLEWVVHMHPNRVRGTDRMIDDLNAREDDVNDQIDWRG